MASLKTLISFDGTNGGLPYGSLIADAAGNLFGTTASGGASHDGTVFEISKTGTGYASTPTTLVSFNGTNGYDPNGSLIVDAAGNLFGTTEGSCTAFEIAKTSTGYASTPITLATFNGGANGAYPLAGLLADAAGDLFGTTKGAWGYSDGTVFEIARTSTGYASTPTTLASFNGANGQYPYAGLVADAAGDLFGTTTVGGASGDGTVFEIAKTSTGYAGTPTTLVSFDGTDGEFLQSGLLADAAGNLFGTTNYGGAHGRGTVFEITKTSTGYATTPTTLVSFNGTNGAYPLAGLIADAAGDLFGTTERGGASGEGTVFEIARTSTGYASTPTTLFSFDCTSGDGPSGQLIADAAGDLFGTTVSGGANNDGTVFELTNTGFQVGNTPIKLPAGNNTVTVTDTMLSGGAVTIDDGTSGNNTISAAGDTAASIGKNLTYVAGMGADSFTGGFEDDTVHVPAAAVGGDTLTGGSGTNELVLTSAGSVGLGGVSKFPTIDLFAGNNSVTLTDTILATGSVTIRDAASGDNIISAAGDTSASKGNSITYDAGTGKDSFTGGFENDIVRVSAAALLGDTLIGGSGSNTLVLTSAGTVNLNQVSTFTTVDLTASNTVDVSATGVSGDTLTGGLWINTLVLTSAGSVNLGGVSNFATINLFAGNSTVTLTDTTLDTIPTGRPVMILDGVSGNNSVSAAGDTAASQGKSLTYVAGTGTDSFTGGFENDWVRVSATAVGDDTLTGGSGINTLVLTSAGSVSLGGVSRFTRIDLASGNTTVTVTDTMLSGGPLTILGAASGNNSVDAADDTAASRGKSLAYVALTGTDSFTGGFESDFVHVAAATLGSDTLTGGSGANALLLTSAGDVALGAVSNFTAIDLFAGNNTVTLTDTTLFGGFVALHAAASGNTSVNAAGDTAASTGKALTYVAGTGTDSFTGGFENDTVRVSAAAVGGDTLTGGSGTNTLALLSAGAVNLGGVSRFATVDLHSGNNTVTLTDTTLSGGRTAIHGAASGNTSITAAGDTAASTGHRLTFFAGTGSDSFTGGFENDTIYAGTGLGTYTAGSGTDRFVFIQDNLPNQTLDNFKVGSDELLFYGVHASNGFDLGATDNTLNPASPAAIDPSIFIANVSGDFTSPDQRFAYDTSNGHLLYSATGSDASESLIATLTGEPAITAGNLLFLH